jgi:hypothetical protein
MKPPAAGNATNCLSCPIEESCNFSAKKIYLDKHLAQGNTGWPVKIVNPEIEDCYKAGGLKPAAEMLLKDLAEDYGADVPVEKIEERPWFGRCVWEADNDVCDDQVVTMTWDDDPLPAGVTDSKAVNGTSNGQQQNVSLSGLNRLAKTALFHMISLTENICERRGRIYGTLGEINYDSSKIWVHTFGDNKTEVFRPAQTGGGHGGGDSGLARQFVRAVDAVVNGGEKASISQKQHLGCSLEEAVRSHAMVFAAEEARRENKIVDWISWWEKTKGGLGS